MVWTLTRNQLKARVLRALSGLSQEEFERETQVENIAGIESGARNPTAKQIAQMCPTAGLTPESCERLMQDYEALPAYSDNRADVDLHRAAMGPPRRPVPEHATSIAGIIAEFEERLSRVVEERRAQREAERKSARNAWERAKGLSFADMALLARTTREFQSWALVELICAESTQAGERARDLAGLAVEISSHVRGSAGWCRRVRSLALAHLASAQDAAGDPGAARGTFAEAERLWKSGEDPDEVLDPDRFASLKASLKAARAHPA